jgi:hypothetical protein
MSTPLLGLALPADGTTNWGTLANTSITALLDSAVAGTTTLTSDADATLTNTAEVANEARQAIILCSGARTALRTITAPAQSKTYVVINNTSGGFGVKLVGVGPTTGVTIPAGKAFMLAWNGADFVTTGVTTVNLATDVTGTLPVANGGTNLSSYTSGGVLFADSTSSLNTNTSLTYFNDRTLRLGAAGYIDGWNAAYKVFLVGGQALAGISGGSVSHLTSNLCDTTGAGVWNYTVSAGGGNRGSVLTQFNGVLTWSATVSTGAGGTFASPIQIIYANYNGNIQFNSGAAPGVFVQYGSASITKKLTSGVASVASGATITPTSDDGNQYNVTALAVPATIAAPSGTSVDGQKLLIRLKDNGTARALTWNAIYRVIGSTLPTTTVATKTTYVGCIYNAADAVWDVVAVTTQA